MATVEELYVEIDRLQRNLDSEKIFYNTLARQNEALIKQVIKFREEIAELGGHSGRSIRRRV